MTERRRGVGPRASRAVALAAAVLVVSVAATAFVLARSDEREPVLAPRGERGVVGAPPFASYADRVVVSNDHGDWTIYLRCRSGRGRTVGPGYVARLVTRDGAKLVDDRLPPGTLNDPTFGGLGAFGWHHARGRPDALTLGKRNAWEVSGRDCARDNRGFGVVGTRVLERPAAAADGRGPFVGLALDVLFSDAFTYPRPLLRVRYRYRFYADVVESWIGVRQLCGSGRCGRTRALAFVKEPKLVAHSRWPFARLVTFDDEGAARCLYTSGGGATGPILDTGQCAHDRRARLRFDYGTETSGAEGGCSERPCLDVVMRATAAGAADDRAATATRAWESSSGLDGWAVASAARRRGRDRDTGSIDGVLSDCLGGSPRTQRARRWETTGRLGEDGRYLALGGLFPAWEGGRGGYDCEPLARLFGPFGETWGVFAAYSVVSRSDARR